MFGVNSSGEDTLSPQFRRTKGTNSVPPGLLSRNSEHERAVSELIAWMRECGFPERRRIILESLQQNGLLDPAADINILIEEELQSRAEKLADQGREEMRRMASAASILRTSL